jgi:hypothetical protein
MTNKKTTNKTLMSFGIFGVFALLSMGMIFAYQGDPTVKGPDYSDERHDAMEEAFASSNYQDWYDLMSESGRSSRVLEVVNEGNFATFVESHEAMEAGDLETSQELRAELGLGQGRMAGNNGAGLNDGSSLGQGKAMNKGSMQGTGQGNRFANTQ